MKALLLAFSLALTAPAFAETGEAPSKPLFRGEIPTGEKEFVEVINEVNKQQILDQFGEPSIRNDVMGPDGSTEISVWHYKYLNTDENGEYYKTTELDFVQDKVVMVVFMNHDVGEEGNQQSIPLQPAPPSEPESFSDVPLLNL
ncbi:MAG TPA: hypothetical protein VFS17_00555 [Methylophilaceae bacterium]|nr:hypothetical protein [Methylophilaceae bacterium]